MFASILRATSASVGRGWVIASLKAVTVSLPARHPIAMRSVERLIDAAISLYLNLNVFLYPRGMDARHHSRVVTDHHVTCHASGRHFPVLMYDLLAGGCMFESSGMTLAKGDPVAMAFAGIPEVLGSVVWAAGKCVGVKFCNELHGAIVEYYGFHADAEAFDNILPKDRFGRLLPTLNKYSA